MLNKVVMITGSTSGIGLGIAEFFAKKQSTLIIHGLLSKQEVEPILLELTNLGAKNINYYQSDLSSPLEIKQLFEEIKKDYGDNIDILINNAGVQFISPIESFPEEEFEKLLRIDLISAFYTIKNVLPLMKKKSWGRIINISSAHGIIASPFKSAYVTAKHGLIGLTKTAALEAAPYSITVNAICPGYVDTPLLKKQIPTLAKEKNIEENEVINKILLASHAIKEFIKIEDIAALAYFLCDSHSNLITGTAIPIDGGWCAH